MGELRSRFPVKAPDRRRGGNNRALRSFRALLQPGYANIGLCYILTAAFVTAPVALLFATRFADPGERNLQGHYLYIRTSLALMIIGAGTGALAILLGAPLSSALMLAGLVLIAGTLLLTLSRCLCGLYNAAYRLPLRRPKSFLV